MKKILSLFVALMYMLAVVAIGYAQDTTDGTSTSTEPEVTAETSAETTEPAEVSEETETPEPTLTSAEPETTDDSAITAVVGSTDTVTTEEVVVDEVETEEDAAEVTVAEETTETTEEVESMTESPAGVEVRVTQLQERIQRAVVHGEEIIASVGNESDTTALQAALDKIKALQAEAAAIPTSGDVSEITAQFVAVKKAVIEAVKEFRTEARKLVKENKRTALKARLKAKEDAKLAKLRERIANAKAKFNAKVTSNILERLGAADPELAAKIESGELSAKDARKAISGTFKKLSSERKSEARQKLTERKAEVKVKRAAAVEKAKERVKVRGKNNE